MATSLRGGGGVMVVCWEWDPGGGGGMYEPWVFHFEKGPGC